MIFSRCWLLCGLLLGLALSSWAAAVSYTVQVVAVSSDEGAQAFQAYLNDEGYPAYIVTVPTDQGYIYRLRVGSFANRAAAAAFAKVMNESLVGSPLNSSPTPALAEGIPQDLISLEPELLGTYDLKDTAVSVVPWGETFAVRSQPLDASEPALYQLDDLSKFKAWRAEPLPDGSVIRVYNESLWPEAWLIETAEELSASRESRLIEVADTLGVNAAALAAFEFEDEAGVPFLVLIEQFNPVSGEQRLLRAAGQPSTGIAARGPELRWFTDTPDIVITERQPLFVPTDVPVTMGGLEFRGDGWLAAADDGYVSLQDTESAGNWRAVVGQPIWSRGNILLTQIEDEVQVYHFTRR